MSSQNCSTTPPNLNTAAIQDSIRAEIGSFFLWASGISFVVMHSVILPLVAGTPENNFQPRFRWLLSAIPVVILLGIDRALYRAARKRRQQIRDKVADDIYKRLNGQENVEYNLFLRSFRFDSTTYYHRDRTQTLPEQYLPSATVAVGNEESDAPFETLLTDSLGSDHPLVALGRPQDEIGAGRIESTDADWQRKFHLLAKNASSIFMVPGPTPGTLAEIEDLIKCGWIEKTVFILPRGATRSFREGWKKCRENFGLKGINAPEYVDDGLVFFVSGEKVHVGPIGSNIRNAVAALKQQALISGASVQPHTITVPAETISPGAANRKADFKPDDYLVLGLLYLFVFLCMAGVSILMIAMFKEELPHWWERGKILSIVIGGCVILGWTAIAVVGVVVSIGMLIAYVWHLFVKLISHQKFVESPVSQQTETKPT